MTTKTICQRLFEFYVCSGVVLWPFIYQPLFIAARSRIGVANMARQRVLTVSSAGGVVCSSVSETSSIISPALGSHSILSHSTPVSYTATQTRLATGIGSQQQISDVSRILNTPSEYHKTCSTLFIVCFYYRVVEVAVLKVVFCFHMSY